MSPIKLTFLILFILASSACSQKAIKTIPEKAEYSVIDQQGNPLTLTQINQELNKADVIYLGEIHDNPDHHAVQLDIIKKLIANGKKPIIGFEFFSREQTSWLLNFTNASKHSFKPLKKGKEGTLLRRRLGWERRDDWGFYFPFLQLAKEHQLTVFGADMDNGIRTRLARAGLDKMIGMEKSRLSGTVAKKSDDYRDIIYQELRDGHCGMASEELVEKLFTTITLRDAYMAESILVMVKDREENQPIVMILGRGHVNYNSGVKAELAHKDATLVQLNIGLYEDRSEQSDKYIDALIEEVKGFRRHDLYALTADRHKESIDHCAAFKKHTMQK